MIKPVLDLFKIHRKMIFGNPSVIVQDVFGKTPKSFNAVDVIFVFLFTMFLNDLLDDVCRVALSEL